LSQKTIFAAGVGGLLGGALLDQLTGAGHRVTRLVRPSSEGDAPDRLSWDPANGVLDPAALEGCDAVICMNGANVAGQRWTDAYKKLLHDSRTQPTTLLAKTLAGLERKPSVFLVASAVGIYGDRGSEVLTEDSEPGQGFLTELATAWEAATEPARAAGIRVVNTRIGVVLSPDGGALEKMLPAFKMGVGGPVGSGDQYMSWIAIEDVVAAIDFCIHNEGIEGPVNLVSPNPATNKAFSRALGRALHRPSFMPLPGFAAKLMFGEMGDALLLGGNRALPKKLTEAGFSFAFPDLDEALSAQMKKD